ncbi:hypothetical protein AB5J49_15525 [Streptomyces sp. R28]|uniref:Superfamily III holin-X n=1 Tax=Streptomyces sp. R28 TaxID=3238628 RepID=A0AB39PW65_9ACTN
MSANQKRLIAFAFSVLISLVLGFAAGLTVAALGASRLAAVSAGGGATVALLAIGVAVIALFDFTDDRGTPPAGPQRRTETPTT